MAQKDVGQVRSNEIVGASLELMAKADEVHPHHMLLSYMRAAHTVAVAIKRSYEGELDDIAVPLGGVTMRIEWNDGQE